MAMVYKSKKVEKKSSESQGEEKCSFPGNQDQKNEDFPAKFMFFPSNYKISRPPGGHVTEFFMLW